MQLQDTAVKIWEKVLYLLEPSVSMETFEIWLKPTHAVSLDGSVFTIETPNEYGKNWIESRYTDLIEKALLDVTGKQFALNVNVASIATNESYPGKDYVFTQEMNREAEKEEMELEHDIETEATPNLNPRYTFDTFVIGNNNRFAHAAALAVSESPAKAYNPLFIYGGSGLGKTHLLHAIGYEIMTRDRNKKVVYVSSEKFTNELIVAIRIDKMPDFRNRYRNVDVLLIDDIQFLTGKERTQEEFFHTFNALYEASKQIVISSDKPPKEITTLEERLRSRFGWGLIADIQKPDLETRTAILQKKAICENLFIPMEILSYIAGKVDSNIRDLEGALTRVIAFATINKKDIDFNMIDNALTEILPEKGHREITVPYIMDTVAEYFHLKVKDLTDKKRTQSVVVPRQIAMFLCRELTDNSLPKIGESFGGRDHTTILHAQNKVTGLLDKDASLKSTIEEITNIIKRS